MTKQLGPTFDSECVEAGLGGLPFSWGTTSDEIYAEQLTAAQKATLDGVVEAHDPTKQLPPPPPAVEDQVLFDHENRIRGLEGQPPITAEDFVEQTKSGKTK